MQPPRGCLCSPRPRPPPKKEVEGNVGRPGLPPPAPHAVPRNPRTQPWSGLSCPEMDRLVFLSTPSFSLNKSLLWKCWEFLTPPPLLAPPILLPSPSPPLPSAPPLPQGKEPWPFRGVCASRLYPYGTCFEEKCFRCGCVLL